MTERVKPGMAAVCRHLRGPLRQAEVCHEIASETRVEINGLWAARNGPVKARPGKRATAAREARIDALKWALGIALGLRPAGRRDGVDAFLEDFRQERLARTETLRRR